MLKYIAQATTVVFIKLLLIVLVLAAAFKIGYNCGRSAEVANSYIEQIVEQATAYGVEQGFSKGLEFQLKQRT